MPRRVGWGLLIESSAGASAWQPVDAQTQAMDALRRLAPIIPHDSWVSMQWRND